MEKPKTITQLSKEQLEDICLHVMHNEHIKTNTLHAIINYITNYIEVEPDEYATTTAVKCEFREILRIIKENLK
jgi:hypothetical protein